MPRRSSFKFDEMSVPELLKLRDQIGAALASKREDLRRQIEELSALDTSGPSGTGRAGARRRTGVTTRSKRGSARAYPLKGQARRSQVSRSGQPVTDFGWKRTATTLARGL